MDNDTTHALWALFFVWGIPVILYIIIAYNTTYKDSRFYQTRVMKENAEKQQQLFEQLLKYQGGNVPPLDIKQMVQKQQSKNGGFTSFLFFLFFTGIILIALYFQSLH